jgi:hypothetical protein
MTQPKAGNRTRKPDIREPGAGIQRFLGQGTQTETAGPAGRSTVYCSPPGLTNWPRPHVRTGEYGGQQWQTAVRAADAAAGRDSGLRRISRITRLAGVAGAACSAIVGIALAQHTGAAAGTGGAGTPGGSSSPTSGHRDGQGGIVIPANPPQPSSGSGQVVSGGT